LPKEGLSPAMDLPGQNLSQSFATDDRSLGPQARTAAIDPFAQMAQRGTSFVSLDDATGNKPGLPRGATDSLEEALMQTNWTPGKAANHPSGEGHKIDMTASSMPQIAAQAWATNGVGPADLTDTVAQPSMIDSAGEQVT